MGPTAPAAGKGERDPPSEDGHPIASAAFRRGRGGQVPGSAAAPSGFPRDARVSPFFTLAAAAAAAPPVTRSAPTGFHFQRGRSRTPPPDGVRLVFLPAEHSSAPTSHAHSCPPAAGAVAAQATGQTGVGGGYRIRRGMSKNCFKGCALWGIPDVLFGTRVPTRVRPKQPHLVPGYLPGYLPEYDQNNQVWYLSTLEYTKAGCVGRARVCTRGYPLRIKLSIIPTKHTLNYLVCISLLIFFS